MLNWFSTLPVCLLTLFITSASCSGQPPPKGYLGKPLAHWLERLRSDQAALRAEAVQAVGTIGPDAREAAPLLRPLLKDATPAVRVPAALALWKVLDGDKDAAAVLAADFPNLPQQQKYQVGAFVLGLKKLDEPAGTMLNALRQDPLFAAQVPYRLAAFGVEAVPLYTRWLGQSTGKDRVALLAALPPALVAASRGEIVAPYLKDADPRCQVEAHAALLAVAARRDAAIETLVRLAEAEDAEVSGRATWILCHQQEASPKAAAVYLRGLKHPGLDVRLAAAQQVLATAPERAGEVLPILAEGLKSTDAATRYKASQRVLGLKGQAEKFTPALMAMLKDPKLGGETYAVLTALAPQAGVVGKEVGDLIFADTGTAARFHIPALGPFVPHFTYGLLKHLDGEDATRKQMAAALARWAPAEHFAKLLPKVAPLLKNEALTDVVLRTFAQQGTNARPAAPDVLALLDGKLTPIRIELIQRTLVALQPEPKVLDGTLDRLKANKELAKDQRLLAAEVALLHPGRRKEAADFVAPLFADRQSFRSFTLARTLENLGRDGAALVPLIRPRIEEGVTPIHYLDRAMILMGPAARDLGPALSQLAEKTISISDLLRLVRVLAAVDPDRRMAVEERINKLFLEALARGGLSEYYFQLLVAHCQDRPGPTKALLPLMLKVFRDHPRAVLNGQVRADLAAPISRLDAAAAAEVLRTLEGELGTFPQCSQVALLGLLRLNPEHPKALAELQKYLADPEPRSPAVAAWVLVRCERVVPGVRDRLEALAKAPNRYTQAPVWLTLMRYDGKLNPAWIDELFTEAERNHLALWELPTLGPLARPLVPRLRALAVNESEMISHQDLLFRIELASGPANPRP